MKKRRSTPHQRASRLGGVLIALLTLALALVVFSDATAQDQKRRSPPAAQTDEEKELMELLDKGQLVTARRIVEELLKKNDRSMIGHYVFGRVLHEAEGNLPQAMFHLGKSRQLYEQSFDPTNRPDNAPWEFHRELLYSIQAVAGQMEEHEYQLEILDYHDALYNPDLIAEHAWPHLQLGQVRKARDVATKAAQYRDPHQRSLGLNTLCAIEGEARERTSYYEACRAAFEFAKQEESKRKGIDEKHESTLAVHAYNAAVAARTAFLPEEAEKLASEGTKRLAFTPANPWRFLVQLYTDQGKMQDAVSALRDMQRWRTRQPPHVRDQVRAETDVVFSTVLLLAAETDKALQLVDLALERPDRRGLTSSTPEQALGAHALLRRALLRTHAELAAEEAVWSDEPGRLTRAYQAAERGFAGWSDEERIIRVLSDEDRLVSTFRVFTRGGIEPVPVWLLGDLVDVLGPGVVAVVLAEVADIDDDERITPYLDAFWTEVAAAQGDEDRALRRAERALDGLPRTEALLRARVAAIAAKAAASAGKPQLHLAYFEQAMQLDPSVIRRLGMRIPCTLSGGQSGTAALVRDLLDASPRLDTGEEGFKITIAGEDRGVSVCLHGPTGVKLSCAEAGKLPTEVEGEPAKDGAATAPVAPKKETAEEYAGRVARAFHLRALAMPLGLSATDLSSLDGSTTVAEQHAREKLRKVLDDVLDDKTD